MSIMENVNNKSLMIVILVAIVSLGAMWLPFASHSKNILGVNFNNAGMDRIVQNFDGLNFLIVAKTWYDPIKIQDNYKDVLSGRRPLYFSAHYPGLPTLIALFTKLTNGPNALLTSIIVSNALLGYALYTFFLLLSGKPKTATWLASLALFFPARMLSNRIVGSNESLFIFFVLISLIQSIKGRDLWSGIFGALAVLTRSPGIILFGAYIISIWLTSEFSWKEKIKKSIPYLLIPVSLLGLWGFYGLKFGSFWAYFQVGGNINLYWPFAVFASHMDWISGIWNEDIIYLFALLCTGLVTFWNKNKKSPVAIFGLLYGLFVTSVAHRDIARYALPIMPIVFLGIAPVLENKVVKIIATIMIVPICLYSWQFVLANYQPIVDWARFL